MRKRSKPEAPAAPSAETVREAALRLLARREHSRTELSRKLAARRLPAALVGTVLDRLEQERLLSDARFAEIFVRSRCDRGYGPLRIRAELQERGVNDALIEQAMGGCEVDWQVQAGEVYRRRFGAAAAGDWSERAKRGRYLAQRGFSSEQIRHVLEARGGE